MVYQDLYNVLMRNPELSPTYFYKTMMGYTYKGVLSFDLYYAYLPDKPKLPNNTLLNNQAK